MTDTYFLQTKIQSKIKDKLLFKAESFNQWIDYFNFKLMPVDLEIVKEDNFLNELNNLHPFQAGVLLLPPMTYYDWHVDDERGVCVNALLNEDSKSFCCFSGESIKVSGSFQELQYITGEYVIFNNQIRHTVFNFDKKRYLFTVEFNENKNVLNYDRLLETFQTIKNKYAQS